MRIGFDIDDTLINLREHAFSLYQKKLSKKIPLEVFRALKTVEIHEPFGMDAEQGKAMWNGLLEEIYYTTCPPIESAVEALQQLDREGHEIYYITARPAEHGERTKKWMQEQGFPIHPERFFCGMKDEEKIRTIQELELDYYFDDKPAVLRTLAGEKVKAVVMDQSYNQDLQMPRIKDWSHLHDIFEK
ncbi:5' nucleotidase, NT5C type [Peribacillus sp. SCS-37]|uniref:5' nucleotidase, NT5C type n=1 Tax=Paraperibacillus esterisolvens TaxID=3115296 RepID=UPI00390684B9